MIDQPIAAGGRPPGEAAEQTEGILLEEPTTADLRAKVTEAWREFAHALAGAVAGLPAGSQLEITLDPTASGTGAAVYSVAVRVGGDGTLVALAVGNAALPPEYRMDRAAVADLVALGWSPPGVIEGSGDHFGLRGSVAEGARLAATVSRTLRDVYGAPHPAFLVYAARDLEDNTISLAPLGSARLEPLPDADERGPAEVAQAAGELGERVRTVVATMLKTPPDELQVDSDGDIGIRAGSAMVFVRVRDNPPLVDVFSPVLTEVEPTEQLYVKLSELTNRMPIGRLYCTSDTVWASVPVFGRDFQATHLMLAVQVMTGLADELDDRLHGEFGGKRFFGEGDKPVRPDDGEHRTGMYL
ncbi:MAG TPA: hypothetical protein VGJ63_07930 [Micromonosporaceae bacterium]|jgi:hypothetical protein